MAKEKPTAQATPPSKPETPPNKPPRARSPNFPIDDLAASLKWATHLYAAYKRIPIKVGLIHAKWELKPESSAGGQRIAALKAYGLVALNGSGRDRTVAISEAGERIIRNAPNHAELLKTAALSPPIFRELWNQYKLTGVPPAEVIENYLEWDRTEGVFTTDAAKAVVEEFSKTLAFAKVAIGDIIDTVETNDTDETTDTVDDNEAVATPMDTGTPVATRQSQSVHVPLPVNALPIPVAFPDGTFKIVTLPKMPKSALEFFKKQIDAYEQVILLPEPDGTGND